MPPKFPDDEPLPYPSLKHLTRWPGCPLSEEYLIPPEAKPEILKQLFPYAEVPGLNDVFMDIHEKKEFMVRDFKVVREGGMNMLVSPYYYRSGGSVIDWMPLEAQSGDDQDEEEFGFSISAEEIKPGCEARLTGLMMRQHEGPGL